MLRSVDQDVVLFGASVADVPVKAMSRDEWHAALEQGLGPWAKTQSRTSRPGSSRLTDDPSWHRMT